MLTPGEQRREQVVARAEGTHNLHHICVNKVTLLSIPNGTTCSRVGVWLNSLGTPVQGSSEGVRRTTDAPSKKPKVPTQNPSTLNSRP